MGKPRCTSRSPEGDRCELSLGHGGRHVADRGLLPGDSRHDIVSWFLGESPLKVAVDAVAAARDLAEDQRRRRSIEVFGHPGAHIPACALSREEEITVAIRAWEEAHGRPNPYGQAGD